MVTSVLLILIPKLRYWTRPNLPTRNFLPYHISFFLALSLLALSGNFLQLSMHHG